MEEISYLLASAAIGGFVITAVSGKFMIPALHRLHFGQTVREEGPTWHNKKNGTPTMGGLCFILGILATLGIVWVMYSPKLPEVLGMPQLQAGMLVLFLAFGSGLIGFLDDFIKVIRHRNLGLTEAQKMILQIALTFGFMFGLHSLGLLTTQVQFPIFGLVDMGLLYYPIAFFGIIFLVNAVNLTDGLDGLANGVSAISATTVLVIALIGGQFQVAVVMAALVGACVGFMPYNMNPAKMFMGDTGATFLGYILATMSIQGLFKFYAIISFAVPFLILGLPIFDTAFAFIRRIAHGQSPMHADRSHIHHRLIDMGLNQKQAVATLYVISAILGLSAVVLTTSGEGRAMLLFLVLCIVAVVAARVVFPKEVKEELHEELEELKEHGHHGHHPADKPEDDGKTEEK